MKLEIKRLEQPILKSFCLGSRCPIDLKYLIFFLIGITLGNISTLPFLNFSSVEGKKKIDKKLKRVKKLWLEESQIWTKCPVIRLKLQWPFWIPIM